MNNQNNNSLPILPRPTYKLSDIISLCRKYSIVGISPPSRQTLINMCQEGRFECVSDEFGDPSITSFGYLVYQDSFWNWVKSLKGNETQEE